jgi:alkylation response protein AidB-like acyl-CoA dehydrogenase
VSRAVALQPLVREHSARTDAERRVPDEVVDALREAGLFKLATPKRYGGYETDMRTLLEVPAAIAEADGSTSWIVSLVNICNWMTGLFPRQAQDDVFGADPDALVSGVLMPTATARRVDGGWRVTGRWGYNSGSWHAGWAVLGVPLPDTDGVVTESLVLIPRADLDLEDTWFVTGMRGSGSNTLVAEDVFVPEHRSLSVPAAIFGDYPTEHKDEALYRSALVPMLSIVLAGPQLGMGKAALDYVTARADRRGISYTTYTKQSDSTAFQLQIADAAMKLDTARLHAERACRDIDEHAARGDYPPVLIRARVRADTGVVVASVLDAINTLVSAHGAGSFAEVSPLQRLWRDANTAGRHAVIAPVVAAEVYGKTLLGVTPNITPLV